MEPYQILLIVWTAIFIITLITEILTDELISIWFCAGSLIALVADAIFQDLYWISIIVFVIVSGASLAVFLVFFRKLIFDKKNVKTNAQELLGQKFKVIEGTSPETTYAKIKVHGIVYSVSCSDELAEGNLVEISNIEGNHFIVTKLKEKVNE